jgi:hypothetical protein
MVNFRGPGVLKCRLVECKMSCSLSRPTIRCSRVGAIDSVTKLTLNKHKLQHREVMLCGVSRMGRGTGFWFHELTQLPDVTLQATRHAQCW